MPVIGKTFYLIIKARTQDIRKKKEAEFDMLSSPVQGYNGHVSTTKNILIINN